MNYKIIVCVVSLCLYESQSFADTSFNVPNNQYVLIERQSNHASKPDYAGFKFIQQGKTIKNLIKYEWISLNEGVDYVEVNSQNFKFGETAGVGKFGIGFEGYRFLWEPENIIKMGESNCALPCDRVIKICLSELQDLWGMNIKQVMLKLELKNSCVQWE